MASLPAHVSVRKYDTVTPISRTEVELMVSLAQKASTSNFRQAYSVVWLSDEETRLKVGALSNNMPQYASAGAAFVICVDFYRLKLACDRHGTEIIADTAENMLLGCADAAIFAERLAIVAETMGYTICYIGGVRSAISDIDELLELPELTFPLFGLTIGRPATGAVGEEKPRLPVQSVLHENKYQTKQQSENLLDKYDDITQDYLLHRSSNVRDSTWTKDMASQCCKFSRPYIKAFLSTKGFNFN